MSLADGRPHGPLDGSPPDEAVDRARVEMRRGLTWLGSAVLVGRLVDLVALGFVFWFVTDERLGEASLAIAISTVVEAISGTGLGVSTAVLRSATLRREQLASAFTLSALTGCTLGLGVALAGPFVERAYGAQHVAQFLGLLAIRHGVLGITAVPLQSMNRALRFREVAAAQTVATLVAAVVRVGVSSTGRGDWALVVGQLVQALALCAGVFVFSDFRPSLRLRGDELRPLLAFGVSLSIADAVQTLTQNVDFLLVGRILGLRALGVYRVAFDVAMEASVRVAELVNRTAIPVFARLTPHPAALRRAFHDSLRSLCWLVAPVVVAVFVGVPDVLALLARGRFLAAIPAARLLVVASAARVVYQFYRPLYIATGRASVVLRLELASLCTLGTLLGLALATLGSSLGELAAALAWLATYPVLLALGIAVARRVESLDPRDYARAIARGLLPVPAVGVAAFAARAALPPHASAVLGLAVTIAATLLAHLATLRIVFGVRPRSLLAFETR